MNYSDFTGEIQHRVEVGEQARAVATARATLTTLGERLQGEEAENLASPLPMEIDRFLLAADSGQRFDWDEFVDRVADRADVDESEAVFRAQAVAELVRDVAPGDEMSDVRNSLPEDYEPLFEFADAEEAQQPWT